MKFDATGKVQSIDVPKIFSWIMDNHGQTKYYSTKINHLLFATEILHSIKNIPPMTYYVVDTPDGTLGRDINGFYTEKPIKAKDLKIDAGRRKSEPVEFLSLKGFGNEQANLVSVANIRSQGQYARLVLFMKCGHCGYESPIETEPGTIQAECYCCGVKNYGTRGRCYDYASFRSSEILKFLKLFSDYSRSNGKRYCQNRPPQSVLAAFSKKIYY